VDIMVDLETLDNRTTAKVLSIGACAFEPEANSEPHTLATFYTVLDLDEQQNRTLNHSTFQWWMTEVNESARKAVFEKSTVTPARALEEFFGFVYDNCIPDSIWSYGASFDIPILDSLCHEYGVRSPFGYRSYRCLRTLAAISPSVPRPAFPGIVSHRADHDAVLQAVWCQKIFAHIRDVKAMARIAAPKPVNLEDSYGSEAK